MERSGRSCSKPCTNGPESGLPTRTMAPARARSWLAIRMDTACRLMQGVMGVRPNKPVHRSGHRVMPSAVAKGSPLNPPADWQVR